MPLKDNTPVLTQKEQSEQDTIRYGIKMAGITIMVVFGFMASCTMMPSFEFIDADAAKTATAEAQAQVNISAQKHKEELARIAAVERLIKVDKVDPVAARCAVKGWDHNDNVCQKFAPEKKAGK